MYAACLPCFSLNNGDKLPTGVVPKGYKIIGDVASDLNRDGAVDRSLLIKAPKKLGGKSGLIILLNRSDSLQLVLRSQDYLDGKWELFSCIHEVYGEDVNDSSFITLVSQHDIEDQHYLTETIRFSFRDDNLWLCQYQTDNWDHTNLTIDKFDFCLKTYSHDEGYLSDSNIVEDISGDGLLSLSTISKAQLSSYLRQHYRVKGYNYLFEWLKRYK